MDANWNILGPVAIGVVIMVMYLIIENRKDKKAMEDSFNKDYKQRDEEESELNDRE
jgi:hypothetical protein